MNFHPLFFWAHFFLFFLSRKYWLVLLHCYKNSPPISKSWIRTWGGRLWEVVAYESLKHIVSKYSSLEYGNCRDFNACANADAMFFHLRVNLGKKSGSSHWEFSVSCASQKYDNATTPYSPFFAPSSVKWSLTEVINKRKFQIFSSQSGRGGLQEVVAYKRFQI